MVKDTNGCLNTGSDGTETIVSTFQKLWSQIKVHSSFFQKTKLIFYHSDYLKLVSMSPRTAPNTMTA